MSRAGVSVCMYPKLFFHIGGAVAALPRRGILTGWRIVWDTFYSKAAYLSVDNTGLKTGATTRFGRLEMRHEALG